MADTFVSRGQTVSGATVSSGTQTVSSGGTAVATLVVAGGTQSVAAGGKATSTSIDATTAVQGVAGSATATVLILGSQSVSGTGVATGDVIDGGTAAVVNGGMINAATVNGGTLVAGGTPDSMGQTSGTTVNAGSLVVNAYGLDSGTVLSGGGETVSAYGSASATTVLAGATLTVTKGGIAIGAIVSSGGVATAVGQQAAIRGAQILGGASLLVSSGAFARNTVVSSGGSETLTGSGTDLSGTVQAGGTLILDPGGIASGTEVGSGGVLLLSGVTVSAGTVTTAGPEVVEATISGVDVTAGGTVDYSAVQVASGGVISVTSGGVVDGTVAAGGSAYVGGGGTLLLSGVIVSAGQTVSVGSNGPSTVSGITVAPGGLVAIAGATVLSGGVLATGNGTLVSSVIVSAGGVVSGEGTLAGYGSAAGQVLGAALTGELFVQSGGVASGTTVVRSGSLAIQSGASGLALTDDGSVGVASGGTASGVSVASGGLLFLLGGIASSVTVTSGGTLEYLSGTLSSVSVSSGGTVELDGAVTIPAGAGVVVSAGGTVTFDDATIFNTAVTDQQVSTMVTSGGLTLLSGAVVDTVSAVVDGSGTLTVSGGGADSSSEAAEGGRIIVSSGGLAIGDKAVFEGSIIVVSGGVASGLVANGSNTSAVDNNVDAAIEVESGGTLSGADIQFGSAFVDSGANVTGLSIEAGSTLYLEQFTLSAAQVLREGSVASARSIGGATISSGGILAIPTATVQSGGTLVLAGSSTSSLTVEAGGLASGGGVIDPSFTNVETSTVAGSLIGATIEAPLIVQSGGVLSGVTGDVSVANVFDYLPANIMVQSGGLVSGLSLLSATEYGGLNSLTSAGESDATLTVSSGGYASSVVLNGGNATALTGAVISGLTANKGRFTLSGRATGTLIGASGQEEVSSGAIDLGGTIASGGVQTVFASGTASATTVSSGGMQIVSSGGLASGTILYSGATQFVATGGTATGTDITGGGTIDLGQLTYSSDGTALFDPLTDTLIVIEDGSSDALQLSGSYTGYAFALAQAADGSTLVTAVPCYCTGTLIRTVHGDVAVEHLAIGDLVVTASGAHRPIRWIGHRETDCRRHFHPRDAMPVRIQTDAFGPGRPEADLWLSPGHAVCLDVLGEVLVPASSLINGATVAQVDVETVTYWHVELDDHDVLLANGLPAESYMDVGNRAFFATGQGTIDPDRACVAGTWDYCRPFHQHGVLVEAVRDQIKARALTLGWRIDDAPLAGLHLVVDGSRIEPDVDGLSARFVMPAMARDVWLVSDTGVPAHLGSSVHGDDRRLGVSLRTLTIDDGLGTRRAVTLDDPRFVEGFHKAESDHRWTNGQARLPAALWEGCRGSFFLRVDLTAAAIPRWIAPVGANLAQTPMSEPVQSRLRLACNAA